MARTRWTSTSTLPSLRTRMGVPQGAGVSFNAKCPKSFKLVLPNTSPLIPHWHWQDPFEVLVGATLFLFKVGREHVLFSFSSFEFSNLFKLR